VNFEEIHSVYVLKVDRWYYEKDYSICYFIFKLDSSINDSPVH
jgi:hypothetical protein